MSPRRATAITVVASNLENKPGLMTFGLFNIKVRLSEIRRKRNGQPPICS
jgi:hypothetical protein